ncbi:MAG: hypothetical protein IJH47_00630 [Oscillospiraceae bacterium]|nr:hypothetical protein [Oscillospiraceae bacterium]
MEGLFVLLVLLALAVVVALIYLVYRIAKEFERIARIKGHTEKRFFWYSFFLGVVGWAMVIALPDRSGTNEPEVVEAAEIGGQTRRPSYEDQLPEL